MPGWRLSAAVFAEGGNVTAAFQALAAPDIHLALASSPEVVAILRGWANGYLRRRFGWGRWQRGPATQHALVDDALQHLLMAVLLGKAQGVGSAGIPALVSWCKRVLDNFVISEYRLGARTPLLESTPQPDPGALIEVRELFSRLAALLRVQVVRSARDCGACPRLVLLEEFLDSFFGSRRPASDAGSAGRRYQRLSRGRRVAAWAWAELCRTRASSPELDDIAAALGIAAARGVRKSPRRASVRCTAPSGSSS